jgi:glucose-1-phosphate thymidylyltransferase
VRPRRLRRPVHRDRLGDDVEIDGAEIEHSIVLPGAALRHVGSRIESSLVGAGATVCRTFEPPGALRLHIGANALVTLA